MSTRLRNLGVYSRAAGGTFPHTGASWSAWRGGLFDRGLLPFRRPESIYKGLISKATPRVQRFREGAMVNTFAETAPLVDRAEFNAMVDAFQIGVDRILIRTVYE
jgi:hypothetical protein